MDNVAVITRQEIKDFAKSDFDRELGEKDVDLAIETIKHNLMFEAVEVAIGEMDDED